MIATTRAKERGLDVNRRHAFFACATLATLATLGGCTVRGTPPGEADAFIPFQDTGTGPRPDTNSPCPVGQIDCFGTCTSVVADSRNCGSCGNACPSGTSCAIGRCDCMAPMLGCDGICLDPSGDRMHCGTCDNVCGSTEECVAGRCVVQCTSGAMPGLCSVGGVPTCVDRAIDRFNCGTCGTQCTGDAECLNGVCTCLGGGTSCGGHCVDTNTDPMNCGACISSCGAGGTCAGGRCTACGTDLTLCGTTPRCVNTDTSTLHCGRCGHACEAGQACMGGACQCTGSLVDCGTGCIDLMSTVEHCGTCSVNCGPGGACNAGACTCAVGLMMCSGSCVDLMRSHDHCGSCPVACGAGQACHAGVCEAVDSFRVLTLDATGCNVLDHISRSGDDRGGVGVTPSTFLVTGDTSTVRMSATDLTGITAVGAIQDGLVSNIDTEQVFVLLSATNAQPTSSLSSTTPLSITQLGELDPATGVLTATRIPLSMPIPVKYGTAVMSGYGEALIGVPMSPNIQWYQIDLTSGVVTQLGLTQNPTHRSCENWGWWGIAERYSGSHYAVYVESTTRIARLSIPDTGTTSVATATVSTFTDLGDMCSITFSTSRNRWYFHHEYTSQFTPATPTFSETAGYCGATWDRP